MAVVIARHGADTSLYLGTVSLLRQKRGEIKGHFEIWTAGCSLPRSPVSYCTVLYCIVQYHQGFARFG